MRLEREFTYRLGLNSALPAGGSRCSAQSACKEQRKYKRANRGRSARTAKGLISLRTFRQAFGAVQHERKRSSRKKRAGFATVRLPLDSDRKSTRLNSSH